MNTRKRLALGAGTLTAIGAAATLIAGTTFGLFSSQAVSGNNTFSSGTVTVSDDAASAPCAVTKIVPGDTSSNNGNVPCTFKINNSSNVPVYAAVDVFLATGKATTVDNTYGSTAAVTPKDLFDGTNSTGLKVTISDGTNNFTVPLSPTNVVPCSLASTDPFKSASVALTTPAADTCYKISNLLLSTSAVLTATTTIGTLTTTWNLPANSTNAYQGGDAAIAFNAHAVQAQNNTLACATAAIGAVCTPTGTFSWS